MMGISVNNQITICLPEISVFHKCSLLIFIFSALVIGDADFTGSHDPMMTRTTTIEVDATNTIIVRDEPTKPVYTVFNGSDICILVEMNLQFKFSYYDDNDVFQRQRFYLTSESAKSAAAPVTVSGWCENDSQSMVLTWAPELNSSTWSMTLFFTLQSSDKFTLDHISLNYTRSKRLFKGISNTTTHYLKQNYFGNPCNLGDHLRCAATNLIQLRENWGELYPRLYLYIWAMRAEAYRYGNNQSTFLGKGCKCYWDTVPKERAWKILYATLGTMVFFVVFFAFWGLIMHQGFWKKLSQCYRTGDSKYAPGNSTYYRGQPVASD